MKYACKKCRVEKGLNDFGLDRRVARGHRAVCKTCTNKAAKTVYSQTKSKHRKKSFDSRAYFQERLRTRRAFLDQIKEATPCADCGTSFPAVCMDFDHVRGKKLGNVGTMWSWDIEKLRAEIAKCEIVCACCHRLRTQARQKEST